MAEGNCGLLPVVTGVALGVVSFIVPQLLSPPSKIYEAPLVPIIRAAIEEMQFLTCAFLFASGLILGVLFRNRSNPLCAAATVLWLPVLSVADMVVDTTSHNLFPFEFGLYAILSFVPISGSWVGMNVYRAVSSRLSSKTR